MAIDDRSKIPMSHLAGAPPANFVVPPEPAPEAGAPAKSKIYITGSDEAHGVADWDGNGVTDYIFGDDPRYKEVLVDAFKLKETHGEELAHLYALKSRSPVEQARLVELENHNASIINAALHRESGVYNAVVANNSQDPDPEKRNQRPANLNYDLERMNSHDPLRSGEMEKDSKICRHLAPEGNAALAESGVDAVRISVMTGDFERKGNSLVPVSPFTKPLGNTLPEIETDSAMRGLHTLVMGRATGTLFEFTASDNMHRENLTGILPDQLKTDSMIFKKNGNIVTYYQVLELQETHVSKDSVEQEIALKKMQDKEDVSTAKARQKWQEEVLPKIDTVAGFKDAAERKDIHALEMACSYNSATPQMKADYLKKSIQDEHLPSALLYIDKGALDAFAPDGVRDVFERDSPAARQIKKDIFALSISDKPAAERPEFNEYFQRGLAYKLEIRPEEYLEMAKKSGQADHIAFAQQMVGEGPDMYKFSAALYTGDVETAKAYASKVTVTPQALQQGFVMAVSRQDLSMVNYVLSRDEMSAPKIRASVEAKQQLFKLAVSDNTVNADFHSGFAKALGITPQEYLKIAEEARHPEHIELAQKMAREENAREKTPPAPEQVKDKEPNVAVTDANVPDYMKAALAAVNIPKDMLAQIRMGSDNLGSGVNVGVAQQERGLSV